jgi:hypothetical protein
VRLGSRALGGFQAPFEPRRQHGGIETSVGRHRRRRLQRFAQQVIE